MYIDKRSTRCDNSLLHTSFSKCLLEDYTFSIVFCQLKDDEKPLNSVVFPHSCHKTRKEKQELCK